MKSSNEILKSKNVSMEDITRAKYPEDILEELIREGIREGIKASYDNWCKDNLHPQIPLLLNEVK